MPVRHRRVRNPKQRDFQSECAVGQGFTKDGLVWSRESEMIPVRCFTFLIPEHMDRYRRLLRCQVGVWFPGEPTPVVGQSIGERYGYDRALEQLNRSLDIRGWTLLVMGNLAGSATDMDAGTVYRQYRGRQCLLIDPVPVEEWFRLMR